MFGKYKELREFLNGHGRLIARLESELYKKIAKENTVECDGCGCLLTKSLKFKQASTVEPIEFRVPPVGYSGTSTLYSEATERIVEHYRCFTCQPKTKSK